MGMEETKMNQTAGIIVDTKSKRSRGNDLFLEFAEHFTQTLFLLESDTGKLLAFNNPDDSVPNFEDYAPEDCLLFSTDIEDTAISDEFGWQLYPFDLNRRMRRQVNYLKKNLFGFDTIPVTIMGCESTGKSTMVEDLGREFKSAFGEEYARTYFTIFGDQGTLEDIPKTARGQAALNHALSQMGTKYAFLDTDLLLTKIWSETLFGECPQWVAEAAEQLRPPLTLLMDIDLEWEADPQRCLPDLADREKFHARCIEELERLNRPYSIIKGKGQERLDNACMAVRKFFR